MAALICGSLAFDTIMDFEGRFAEQILPDQLHILNVSFLVPALRRDFGGCAGNIAYSLKLLGGEPLPMATVGSDGADYLARLEALGIATQYVKSVGDTYTAQAMIMTDRDNNQITAFHPGAMMQAHISRIEARSDIKLGIISPDGRDAMLQHAEQFKAAVGPGGADVIYDPVGGDYAEPALRSIAWEGRYLVVGFPAGIPKLPLNLTLLKSCDVCGVFWGAFAARDPAANAAHVEELFRLWRMGQIAPRVSATYPLARGGEAIAALAARNVIGKLVVTLD